MNRLLAPFMALSLGIVLPACGEGEGDDDTTTTLTTTTTTAGTTTTGDGDGDTASETMAGDGDGDTATGDGDGDTATGDGDSTTGDGDGDCEPYGNPGAAGDQCCPGEQPVGLMGIEGNFCSPMCDTATPCPAVAGLMPQCALTLDDPMTPTQCAVICAVGGDNSDCPTGSTCKDTMQGAGICTYP